MRKKSDVLLERAALGLDDEEEEIDAGDDEDARVEGVPLPPNVRH